jgi:hypothetical protein
VRRTRSNVARSRSRKPAKRIDPGVVDEDVQAAEPVDRGLHHRLHVGGCADVGADRQRAAGARHVEPLGQAGGLAEIEVSDHDGRSGLVESLGDPAADAHRAAGDDRRPAAEIDHLSEGLCGVCR